VRRCFRTAPGFAPWNETNSNWTNYDFALAWSTAGGDFDPFLAGAPFNLPTVAAANAFFTIPTGPEFVAMAKDAVTNRNGTLSMILKRVTEAGDVAVAQFASSDHDVELWWPYVTISYTTVVSSARPTLLRNSYITRYGRRPTSYRPSNRKRKRLGKFL
jgi:hypothetical protein